MLFKPLVVALAIVSLNLQAQLSPDLSKRVFEVLNATADEARKWDDKATAARTQAQIADLIWDNNRDNAITYLKAAWDAAGKVEEPKRERSAFANPSRRNAVRREVLLVAHKRARELAEQWLEQIVEESKSGEKTERGTFDDRTARSAVLLQMAQEVVADNPQAAAELLIDSLRDGVSFNLQSGLLHLQRKDPALAETVVRAAVARLRTAGMIDPNELLTLNSFLFTPGRVFGANTADNRNQVQLALGGSQVSMPAGRQNPALAREFLDVAADLLLTAPVPDGPYALITARRIVSTIGSLFREMSAHLPEKAALLQQRARQLDSEARFSTTPIPRKPDMPEFRPGESKESFAERRVDLLEESAAKARDALSRDIGYANAAVATMVERYERGLDLAGKIGDKTLREGVRSWLIYRAVLHLIAAGNLDQAHRLNLKNDDAASRAVCLVAGAQRMIKDKDTDRAGEWLREAGALVRRSDPDESMARIALGIVSTYGSFDTQAAVDWLLYAVKLIRKAPPVSLNDDRAPELKGISGITPVGEVTRGTSGFSLQTAVAVFPPDQFEQVLYVLNDMTPQEARGIAVLTLCRNFLSHKEVRSKI
ncbi:MAG TPA: hypothetical protein VFB65_24080 [Pyrinomonadaceae bacterium]|nr:hypothetical protein [Pyrinomonadaceae bacterium]